MERHRQWLAALPEAASAQAPRAARELAFVLRSRLSRLLEAGLAGRVDGLAARVQAGELALWDAAEQLRRDVRELL